MKYEELILLQKPEVRALLQANLDRDPATFALQNRNRYPGIATLATQLKILQRAKRKLPRWVQAGCILPPRAYEQASSELVSQLRQRFQGKRALDLTCGLGVDAVALAAGFEEVVALEPDPVLAEVVQFNYQLMGLSNITVHTITAEQFLEEAAADSFDLIFLDPDRRDAKGKKQYLLEATRPDFLALQDQILKVAPQVYLKASPMFDLQEGIRLIPGLLEAGSISLKRECKEMGFLAGRIKDAPLQMRATFHDGHAWQSYSAPPEQHITPKQSTSPETSNTQGQHITPKQPGSPETSNPQEQHITPKQSTSPETSNTQGQHITPKQSTSPETSNTQGQHITPKQPTSPETSNTQGQHITPKQSTSPETSNTQGQHITPKQSTSPETSNTQGQHITPKQPNTQPPAHKARHQPPSLASISQPQTSKPPQKTSSPPPKTNSQEAPIGARYLHEAPLALYLTKQSVSWLDSHWPEATGVWTHPSGYYCHESPLPDFPGRIYEARAWHPYKPAQLRKKLSKQALNLTTRQFDLPVSTVRKDLKIKEGGQEFLILTKLEQGESWAIRASVLKH